MRLRDEGPVRGRDDEERVDPRASLLDDVAVLHDAERRAGAHPATRLRTQTSPRVRGMLPPPAIGLAPHRRARRGAARPRPPNPGAPRPHLTARPPLSAGGP